MLNKSEDQVIRDITGSMVNQAGGNVVVNNYGMSPTEVISIVRELVSSDMAVYRRQAEHTAQDRFEEFSSKLEERIDQKVSDRLSRFNEPSMQLATRDAALGYIRNGNPYEAEALIDLLIERVLVEEHTTSQKLIDQAIRILPNLSNECLALITLIAFSNLQRSGSKSVYDKWIECMNPVIDILPKVNGLDIAYLMQAECAALMPNLSRLPTFVSKQMKSADLFFRHPASEKFSEHVKERYQVEFVDGGITFNKGCNEQAMIDFISTFMFNESQRFFCLRTDSSELREILTKKNMTMLMADLNLFIKESKPFSEEEIKDFFISVNPNWKTAFELLERADMRSTYLTPVGNYIACRQITALSDINVDLGLFYK